MPVFYSVLIWLQYDILWIIIQQVGLFTQYGEEVGVGNKNLKFSVAERLRDWKIERKKRNNGVAHDIVRLDYK